MNLAESNRALIRQTERPFIYTVDIVSSNETVSLPLSSQYYNDHDFTVDWGDGSEPNEITAWDQPETTHTLGQYNISTLGRSRGWTFQRNLDREKL